MAGEVSGGNSSNWVRVTKHSIDVFKEAENIFIYRSFTLDLRESRIFSGGGQGKLSL